MSRSGSKAKVAIIYSDNDKESLESRNLAFYLCGLLVKGGWGHCVMIPFGPDGPRQIVTSSKISIIPMKLVKPLEVPVRQTMIKLDINSVLVHYSLIC